MISYTTGGPACVPTAASPPPPLSTPVLQAPELVPAPVPPADAPVPTASPPLGTAYVRSSADLSAAVADATVSVAVLLSHIAVSAEVSLAAGRALTIVGHSRSCAGVTAPPPSSATNSGSFPPPLLPTSLSSPLCTISGGNATRIFRVAEGASLGLVAVALVSGRAPPGAGGGAVLTLGTLFADGAQFVSNTAPVNGTGGAISGKFMTHTRFLGLVSWHTHISLVSKLR